MNAAAELRPTCAICPRVLEVTDALPFRGSHAHFSCVASAQLATHRRGLVLMTYDRRGPAFDNGRRQGRLGR